MTSLEENLEESVRQVRHAFRNLLRPETPAYPKPDLVWRSTDRSDLRCTEMDGRCRCRLIVNHPGRHHG